MAIAITVQFQVDDAVLFALNLLSSLVTVEDGFIWEGARLIACQQYGCLAAANASGREIGTRIIGRCVHVDLDAGQGGGAAGFRWIGHDHLDVHGGGEALVIIVVDQQLVA